MRLPQTENLTCSHVSVRARDIADIKSFEIVHPETGGGLERYLKRQALFDEHYERLMKTYERYGFHRLPANAEDQLHQRLKPAYDESCIFMYQLLHEMRY